MIDANSYIYKAVLLLLELSQNRLSKYRLLPSNDAMKTELLSNTFIDTGVIIAFSRSDLFNYIMLLFRLAISGMLSRAHTFYYINDDRISFIFPPSDSSQYRIHAKHIHAAHILSWKRFVTFLTPLVIRADLRFLCIEPVYSQVFQNHNISGQLINQFAFMMFSNVSGKLMLAPKIARPPNNAYILKTTVNNEYLPVLKKEYEVLSFVSKHTNNPHSTPKISETIELPSGFAYLEEYIEGSSLNDNLLTLAQKDLSDDACKLLDRLDSWHSVFKSAFTGTCRSNLSALYSDLFNSFRHVYGTDSVAIEIVSNLSQRASRLDFSHPGLPPIISHNDLWPANFIVRNNDLVAIDWERATPNRSGFFDYYWMIISTCIVYLKEKWHLLSYSHAFRQFLSLNEEISRHATHKLNRMIKSYGYNEHSEDFFMALFLLELSISGFICLGHQTDMDKLAYQELLNYYNNYYSAKS